MTFSPRRSERWWGIAVYVNDKITASSKKVACKSIESLLLDLHIGQRQIALVWANKPLSVDNNSLKNDLAKLLDEASLQGQNLMCTGDLNCDLLHPLDNNKQGKCLLDLCHVYDLDSLISVPKRISKSKASCLDVILTNVPTYTITSAFIDTGLSDHNLVYTFLNAKLPRTRAEKVIKRSFKTFSQQFFLEDLSQCSVLYCIRLRWHRRRVLVLGKAI